MKKTFKIALTLIAAAATPATVFTVPYLLDRFQVYHGQDIHYAYESAAGMWRVAFAIGLMHAVLLGLPTYFWVQKRGLIRWWMGVLCGFVIGCIPMAIITWPLSFGLMRETATFDGVTTIIDGVPTYAGWVSYFEGVLSAGGLGITGGLAAWIVWRLMDKCCMRLCATNLT